MTCNLLSQLYFTLPACLVNNNVKVNNNLPCDKFVQVRSRAPLLGSCCICRKLPGSFLASPLFSIQEPVLFGAFYLLPRPRNSPATNLYRISCWSATLHRPQLQLDGKGRDLVRPGLFFLFHHSWLPPSSMLLPRNWTVVRNLYECTVAVTLSYKGRYGGRMYLT